MREKLLEIFEEIRPDVELEKEKRLITDSILDSFDIISLVTSINDAFDIELHVGDLIPDNFNSIEGMLALIERSQQEDQIF